MSIQLYNEEKAPDEEYFDGRLDFLVVGNKCRRLDGRRTGGHIVEIFESCGMFRFEILEYEDKGNHWDLPFEDIHKFQFSKESLFLESVKINQYEKIIEKFDKALTIAPKKEASHKTESLIDQAMSHVTTWLSVRRVSFETFNRTSTRSLEKVSALYKDFMDELGLGDIEKRTATNMVLNPNSGEWIKATQITMAEMGLSLYNGKVMRDLSVYGGCGDLKTRRKYIVFRLAFLRVLFKQLGYSEVTLFRGMSSEGVWNNQMARSMMSMTFDPKVADQFSDFTLTSKYKSSYMIKMTIPVEQLFMTYIETEEMNNQYRESEAIIYGDLRFKI